jgi:hypothetical protein
MSHRLQRNECCLTQILYPARSHKYKGKSNLDGGRGAATSLLDLDLDVGDGAACPGQICDAGVGVLGVVVGNGGLDGILSEHRAVKLDGRKAQLLRHIGVLNLASLIKGHTANQLSQITGRGDSTTTAESLEDDIIDTAGVLVHTDLQLHDIATGGRADETGTHVLVARLHGADIARVVVVVKDLLVVSSALHSWGGSSTVDGLGGLEAGERSEGAASCDRADARGDSDEALEHCDWY